MASWSYPLAFVNLASTNCESRYNFPRILPHRPRIDRQARARHLRIPPPPRPLPQHTNTLTQPPWHPPHPPRLSCLYSSELRRECAQIFRDCLGNSYHKNRKYAQDEICTVSEPPTTEMLLGTGDANSVQHVQQGTKYTGSAQRWVCTTLCEGLHPYHS